ncbi:hypothetical protein [Motiliproteus sediminis]|uniref:hypothetical protein n=1 Tax=Motiliproteus sediminis TaxID=1468178 RepID=UPI001AEFEDA1|nr:hypothetical protein [Motiliproteus sediminis]
MIPKYLYESLPLLYLAAGLIALNMLSHSAGTLAGLILIIAGSLVSYWRYSHRIGRRAA